MPQPPGPIIAAARQSQIKWHVPASVSLAQWALESGWGAHSPGNNPFGIKAMRDYDTQHLATQECIHGHIIDCVQTFSKFNTVTQAFDCHAKLLATSIYYRQAMAALPDNTPPASEDVVAFVRAMAPHYATDPMYANKIIAVINDNNLNQYNKIG